MINIKNYQYHPQNIIGKGATGQVYLGTNIYNNQPLAIKVIPLSSINNQVLAFLLAMEKLALSSIHSPYVLKLYQIIQNQNYCYIITQYLPNGTLQQYIKKFKRLSQPQAIQFLRKIAIGLMVISQNNFVHRDLKTANIMLRQNYDPVIIDFGYSENIRSKRPQRKYNVGSPAYMSPQAYLQSYYTQKSDIWGLGVIFHEMLSGKVLDQKVQMKKYFRDILRKGVNLKFIKCIQGISKKSFEILHNTLKANYMQRINAKDLVELIQRKQTEYKKIDIIQNRIKKSISYNDLILKVSNMRQKNYSINIIKKQQEQNNRKNIIQNQEINKTGNKIIQNLNITNYHQNNNKIARVKNIQLMKQRHLINGINRNMQSQNNIQKKVNYNYNYNNNKQSQNLSSQKYFFLNSSNSINTSKLYQKNSKRVNHQIMHLQVQKLPNQKYFNNIPININVNLVNHTNHINLNNQSYQKGHRKNYSHLQNLNTNNNNIALLNISDEIFSSPLSLNESIIQKQFLNNSINQSFNLLKNQNNTKIQYPQKQQHYENYLNPYSSIPCSNINKQLNSNNNNQQKHPQLLKQKFKFKNRMGQSCQKLTSSTFISKKQFQQSKIRKYSNSSNGNLHYFYPTGQKNINQFSQFINVNQKDINKQRFFNKSLDPGVSKQEIVKSKSLKQVVSFKYQIIQNR